MFRKILFVVPSLGSKGLGEIAAYPHTGIGYLSTFMSEQGIDNEVIDMRLGYSQEHLFDRIDTYKPELIAISSMTYKCNLTYELIAKIKENRETPIVIGGPHSSVFRKRVLEECKADYAIKREGEYPLLELCQGKDLSGIEGLIYRKGNSIVENQDREPIKNLDALPFPRYEKFELDKYAYSYASGGKGLPIISSRGCPYQCIFCSVKEVVGRNLRMRSAGSILREIEYWYQRGIRVFFFMDDNFTMDRDRIMELCRLLENSKMEDLRLSVPQGVRADKVDYESLRRMKEVGFWFLSFGVEAGNNQILKSIKKQETIEDIERAIDLACCLGYDVGLFFIIGHPNETPRDFEDSLKLALRYPISHAYFFHAVPFPGTELYDWVQKNGYLSKDFDEILKSHNWFGPGHNHPLFWTPYFTLKERQEAFIRGNRVGKQVKKNNMRRKLSAKSKIFGRVVTEILYAPPLYRTVQSIYYCFWPRKVINFVIEKFRLGINQF